MEPIRFFVSPDQITSNDVTFTASDSHHLKVVLKAAPGQAVIVLDGTGNVYSGRLVTVTKSLSTAEITGKLHDQTELTTRITVAQALPKIGDRLDQVLQHGTELGVHKFIVFQSDRSLELLRGERRDKKLLRWQEIVRTAAEQSQRILMPGIEVTDSYSELLDEFERHDLVIFADVSEKQETLRSLCSRQRVAPRSVLICIGPESGFSPTETGLAKAANANSVSLGPRVLRTETAALYAVAQLIWAFSLE